MLLTAIEVLQAGKPAKPFRSRLYAIVPEHESPEIRKPADVHKPVIVDRVSADVKGLQLN